MQKSRVILPPKCECADHACPAHPGVNCQDFSQHVVRRVDFAGEPRVRFCDPCFEDAMESGLFG